VGPVDVRTSRGGGKVRLEIRNRERSPQLTERARGQADRPDGRGRGLGIAGRAARDLGGALRVESGDGETRAVLELPADRAA
jgi:hypothetical protein